MKTRKIPMRMCLGCRSMFPKKELTRIVQDKDGNVSLDATGKKQGRGAYICRNSQCLKKAVKARAIQKAFELPFSSDVLAQIQKELED
ncbi:MAG: YlxR family protein [Bacillota bacterium]|nr:YlxR family protein [Bacillota bacterium]